MGGILVKGTNADYGWPCSDDETCFKFVNAAGNLPTSAAE